MCDLIGYFGELSDYSGIKFRERVWERVATDHD
ncbi:MAG: hypothetical protein A4E35_00647 [Methanoregula sp. PtaU1.Bin051]|nr:MAG: hypothetical protein A4E35_00647 [Methanoregula sp. PtaU1.Bin051]